MRVMLQDVTYALPWIGDASPAVDNNLGDDFVYRPQGAKAA
ncbi:MAG: hypothetical protein ABSD67_17590 [Terracidiphilus sp.]|jgi:hypothetical protein